MEIIKIDTWAPLPKNFTGEVEYSNGTIAYYKNGLLHREDTPAVVSIDRKEYWVNGLKHRVNGPAVETNNGTECYFENDKLHRIGGPAVKYFNSNSEYQYYYWIHGERVTKEAHDLLVNLLKLKK